MKKKIIIESQDVIKRHVEKLKFDVPKKDLAWRQTFMIRDMQRYLFSNYKDTSQKIKSNYLEYLKSKRKYMPNSSICGGFESFPSKSSHSKVYSIFQEISM